MARRTHPVMRGAANVAPTAPHGTPPEPATGAASGRKSGPERFWDLRRVRIALAISAILSIAFHWWVGPWTIRSGLKFEIRDTDGDIAIPVDLIEDEAPPPPPPVTPPPTTTSEKPEDGPNARDAGPPPRKDAGAKDAAIADAEHLDASRPDVLVADAEPFDATTSDSGLLALADAAGSGEAGALAVADSGTGGVGTDPESIVGGLGKIKVGDNLVDLVLRVDVIRKHPAGARLSKLVRAAPQWDDALKGTTVDPVRDADWVYIYGPALTHTEKDVILIHYSVPDAVADEAIEAIRRRSHNGAAYDAGVPGVKATLAHADRAPRVFLRGKNKAIAVVPPDHANVAARILATSTVRPPRIPEGAAMWLKVKNPNHPLPQVPARITEGRMWILPTPDGGADITIDFENPDAAGASDSAAEIKTFLQRFRGSMEGALANMVSRGLINGIEVSNDGRITRLHVLANSDQVDAIIGFVAAQAGIDVNGPAPAPSGSK